MQHKQVSGGIHKGHIYSESKPSIHIHPTESLLMTFHYLLVSLQISLSCKIYDSHGCIPCSFAYNQVPSSLIEIYKKKVIGPNQPSVLSRVQTVEAKIIKRMLQTNSLLVEAVGYLYFTTHTHKCSIRVKQRSYLVKMRHLIRV